MFRWLAKMRVRSVVKSTIKLAEAFQETAAGLLLMGDDLPDDMVNEEVESRLRDAISLLEPLHPHADVITPMAALGRFLMERDRDAEAVAVLHEALRLGTETLTSPVEAIRRAADDIIRLDKRGSTIDESAGSEPR